MLTLSQLLHCTHVKFSRTGASPSVSGSDRLVDLLTPPPPDERLLVPPPLYNPYDAALLKRFRAEPAREREDDEAAREEDRADEAAAEATDRTAAAVVDLPLRLLL